MMTVEEAEKRVLLKVLAGSHVHGLNVEGSDRDEEAIIVEPIHAAMGLQRPFEELIRESPEVDVKYVSLRKWCQLALKGNPNFLLALFAPSSHVLSGDARGNNLRAMKDAFISKQAIRSHLGYMQGQRQRMLKGSNDGRGKPRTDLVEQHGYDTKYGMHLLRLAWQGLELAKEGQISLPMPTDIREVLLKVRAGQFSLDWVLRQSAVLEADMKAAYDTSSLPDMPDYATVERWMTLTYFRWWSAEQKIEDWREGFGTH